MEKEKIKKYKLKRILMYLGIVIAWFVGIMIVTEILRGFFGRF